MTVDWTANIEISDRINAVQSDDVYATVSFPTYTQFLRMLSLSEQKH
jgi:hypothetical protein